MSRTVLAVPSISFITACDPVRAQHLGETAGSVHAAASYLSGQGVDADWIIVVDGPGPLPRFRTAEYTTLVRLPARSGASAARNAGLVLSRASWVCALDADDMVLPAGIGEVLSRYGSRATRMRLPGLPVDVTRADAGDHPGVEPSWIVADHTWMDRPGTGAQLSRPVELEAGQLADAWSRGWPAEAANLIVDRSAALTAGGWPALPAEDDTGFLLSVSEFGRGVCDPVPAFKRRTWEGQVSASAGFEEHARSARWLLADQVNARRSLLWPHRASVAAPA